MKEKDDLKKDEKAGSPEKDEVVEVVDLAEYAQTGRKPPRARRYRITIDKTQYVVEQSSMTGRELLMLASKNPPERFMISQKPHGGPPKQIKLDESVDFTTPGLEKFLTLPLDQTEG